MFANIKFGRNLKSKGTVKNLIGGALLSFLTSQIANANTVYSFSSDTGTLYSYDAAGSTSTIGVISPTFKADLDSLSSASTNIDITYFGGYIYGLVSGFGNNGTSALFRLDVNTGQEDATYGINGIQNITYQSGTNLTDVAAEGITNDGNELIIAYATTANAKASTVLVRVNSNTGQMTGTAEDTRNFPSQSGQSTSLLVRDVDGMGRCGSRIVNVNTENNNDVYIQDMGVIGSHAFEQMTRVVDADNKPRFFDVAFLGGSNLVVAGSLGGGTSELKFYSVNSGGTATLTNSVSMPSAVTGVASDAEANCTIPVPARAPNYQCYDLMDHERDTYKANINKTIIDQFARTNVRIGHAVSLFNPVDISGEAKPETEDHLVCYETFPQNGTAASNSLQSFDVEITNEVEANQLVSGHADELCLVSTKRHL